MAVAKLKFLTRFRLLVLELADQDMEEKFGVSAAAATRYRWLASLPARRRGGPGRRRADRVHRPARPRRATTRSASSEVVRAVTGLGLKEAQDLVDGAPRRCQGGHHERRMPTIILKRHPTDAGGKAEIK